MMGVDDFLISIVGNLIAAPISDVIDNSVKDAFQRRKIRRRVDEAIDEVVIPIIPFLEQEKITEQQQYLLIEACERDLKKLTENPAYLFQGSLDGQKIFDNLYSGEGKKLPDVVIDEKLEGVYSLLFPRIATVVCKIPAAVKDWENEAWTENYRRLDDLAEEFRALFKIVDTLDKRSDNETERTLQLIKRTLAQKIGLELDITGLRADRPVSGRLTDFFIHPELNCILSKVDPDVNIHFSKDIRFVEQDKRKIALIDIKKTEQSFTYFTAKNTKAILEGAAGSGKSTWSKWLQREIVNQENWTRIAIRVELRALGDLSLPTLPELIRKAYNPNLSEEITGDKIRKWLDNQQIVFILDGFDEVAPKNRDAVRDWILDLENAAQGCPFIVTSRPLTTSHLEDLKDLDWSAVNVLPFDQERIINYIQRWYKYAELLTDSDRNIDASELADQWSNDPTIEPLTGNPLMLTTLLMVHHLDGELPSGRSELYKRYVEGMLGVWDNRRNVKTTDIQLTLQQKGQILRGIALHFHLEEQDQLDEDKMAELVKGLLQKFNIADNAEKVLEVLRERTGLIIGPGIYSFVHKSVAEYLVAEAVFQGDQKDKNGASIDRLALLSHRADDRWKIVIFLWAGLASVTDLVSFIESCKLENSWPLAYGLLYDQYDKIPSENRRRLMLDLINIEQFYLKGFGISELYCNYSYFDPFPQEFSCEDFDLKGITYFSSLFELIDKSINSNELAWKDVSEKLSAIRDLVWLRCVTNPQDLIEWRSCLENLSTIKSFSYDYSVDDDSIDIDGHPYLIAFIIEINVYKCLINKNIQLKDIITIFNQYFSKYKYFVPLYLIAMVTHQIVNIDLNNLSIVDNLSIILPILSAYDINDIDSEWLQGTSEWNIPDDEGEYFFSHYLLGNFFLIDILTTFLEEIEAISNQGIIEKDEHYQGAMRFVQELLERRESEKANQGLWTKWGKM